MINLSELKNKSLDRWLIVDKCKNKNVLELGCVNHSIKGIKAQRIRGTWLFEYLNKFSKKAMGIDIDEKGVNYLHKQGYDIYLGDAQNFNIDNKKFDVIVASKLVDHLLNFEEFLKSCHKNLVKGGILIISDDNILCLPRLIFWYFKKILGNPDKDITVKPIPDYFKNFCYKFKFSIDEIEYFFGENTPRILKFFRLFIPKTLIYPPLFYPSYIIILKKND